MSRKTFFHLAIISLAAVAINLLPMVVGKVPLRYQFSSDAEVHVVFWQKYSSEYRGNFEQDTMFNYKRAKGDLLVSKVMVGVLDAAGIDVWTGSILVSVVALAIFLTGIYAVVTYTLKNSFLALIVALGSTVPTHSLGGTTWGFLVDGYLPRNLAAGIAVWILLLYFRSIASGSRKEHFLVFILLGLCGNWYPILFLHLTMVLLLAEVIRRRSIHRDVIIAGVLFSLCIIPAVLDILHQNGSAGPIDLMLVHSKQRYLMFLSWYNALFKYFRRIIVYGILISLLAYVAKKISVRISTLSPWYPILFASLLIAIPATFLENYTIYAQYYFSRTSLWGMFACMVIVATLVHEILQRKKSVSAGLLTFLIVGFVFGIQSNAYQFLRTVRATRGISDAIHERISLYQQIKATTQPTDMILIDPSDANKIRAYASRSIPVSWKDRGVAIYDGRAAHVWDQRYKEVAAVFDGGDIEVAKNYGRMHGIRYLVWHGELISL